MQTPSSFLGVFEAFEDRFILVELTFLDGHVNTDDVLPDHTSSSNVQMPEQTQK
jgi:hypothetical protein